MRFLLVGNLAPAVAEAIVRHKHTVATPDSLALTDASTNEEILRAADKAQLDVVTNDAALMETPYALKLYFHRALVYLQLPGGDIEHDDAIDRLFERYKRLTPQRLYTVTENRVKVRQLPGAV